jgi:hypothetical protein
MRWTLLLSIVATAMSHQLGAQELTTGRLQAVLPYPSVRLSGVAPRMHSGALVRLGIAGGPRLSGRYVGIVGDTMLLSANRVGTVVFDSLWTWHRPIVSNAIRGALLGALVGGAYRLVHTARVWCDSSFTSYFYPWPDCRGRVGNIGRGALTGALVGAVAGVALAEIRPIWKLRFP